MVSTVGIVGCGLIGHKRALAAARLGLTVVAVADVDAARASSLVGSIGEAGAGAFALSDWREVVALKPDLVVVATTHDHLAEISLAAIESGSHVLVEKPAARTAAELSPVVDAAARHGRVVKVGFNHRFHPALRQAHEMAAAGELGPLMFVRGRYGHGGRLGMENEWRCRREISGGGELIDQGSHLIDLSRWFLGDLVEVQAMLRTQFWEIPVEDNCFMGLQTPSGQVAWLHASWTEWKNTFSFEVFGRDGKLQIDGLGGSYGAERLTRHRMSPKMGPPETTVWEFPLADCSWDLELRDLVMAIREGRHPEGDIHDAMANLQIIGNLYAVRP